MGYAFTLRLDKTKVLLAQCPRNQASSTPRETP